MIEAQDRDRIAGLLRKLAAEELLPRFTAVTAERKPDGSLITAADLAMQRRLQEVLAAGWPGIELLGEEMPAERQVALLESAGTALWCLDPLDGTSNFASGIPFFAVSLALLVDGSVQAAWVYDPVRDECFSALRGGGAQLNGVELRPRHSASRVADAMAIVDIKRLPPALVTAIAQRAPFRSQRSFGSVALDWCWIASGRCQVYLHGGQKLWDYAAGQLILRESGAVGGILAAYDGDWTQRLTLQPRIAMAAADPRLLTEWRDWVGAALSG
jgi:myo-inositol-1(or 4)-monophosphatase